MTVMMKMGNTSCGIAIFVRSITAERVYQLRNASVVTNATAKNASHWKNAANVMINVAANALPNAEVLPWGFNAM
jgi:hypothetical protein